ncbi:RAM signaling pathway protein-domain-containing protein [Suillus subalutaceus]|uniref:RAM signaling pathway protein-domain-containing protein n=1 Tax=Suillus subalutaceus TaxID=48586 RepID=UPI001B85E987|nr:RAM signaling pathway protein-domain-containing protein [Suillus subalutaceus]KAG1849124.1 RAM signaling pathway protein-domain-containing protein [Suillus subalutaceus]
MSASDADRAAGRTSPFPGTTSRHGALSPLLSASLTEEHIAEALRQSSDNGATLDLTHRNLTDVGEDGAKHLATMGRNGSLDDESSVFRIALGYNRLATLPTAFALLSRLRYLNLQNNSFTSFPDVLTVMPSLEILDISRNKIKRLPGQSGSLINLRVFCLSRNKITRIPGYLTDFRELDVLKVDHNPIEWPPKYVMETPDGGREWITFMQKWMRNNSRPRLDVKQSSVDSFLSANAALDNSIEDQIQSWSHIQEDSDSGVTPHARSFSIDANFSPLPGPTKPTSPRFDRPPRLRLGVLPPFKVPPRSVTIGSYLPTPAESVSSTDDDSTAVPEGPQHGRNASFTGSARDRRPALFGKKSLPDLRAANVSDGVNKQTVRGASKGVLAPDLLSQDEFSMPSPLSHRQDSSSSSDGSSHFQSRKAYAQTPPTSASPTSGDVPRPVPEVERHAYFKRLSALPATAMINNLSCSLRSLVECARSLFFAVSQVYQALSHYITYTNDRQLSSVLKKVTDPAYTYMMQLNGALDRFDAICKKTTPPPSLCRALVESSRDTAAMFGKAIAMMSLQLNILASKDDDRYMRSLVLIFYGAMAEISSAWQSMVPHIEAIKPHLSERRRHHVVKPQPVPNPSPELPPSSAPPSYSPFNPPPPPHSIPIARSRPTQSLGRARTTRRHAGSFSSKDVEIGKSLPSYDLPVPFGAVVNSTATTLRAGQRHPALPLSASTSSLTPSLMNSSIPWTSLLSGQHSRQASQTSLTPSAAPSSPYVPARRPILEIPPSRTLVDKDALDAVEVAVEAAPAVWEMLKEIVDNLSEGAEEFRNTLLKAKSTTERLRTNINAMRCGDPGADRKRLREDAHVFVKIVVKLSNLVKTHGTSHAVFSDLLGKMLALTNATQEFVMLLHVSSFSPSTPRPYSPMTAILAPSAVGLIAEDGRLGANLSRSRSSTQPKALKVFGHITAPRSALPNQSFNIPRIRDTSDEG